MRVSAKIGTCTVVSVNVTLVEDKMRRFKRECAFLAEAKICTFTLESTHSIFNKCPIYTHDCASAKFRTNSQETDYSVVYFLSVSTSAIFNLFLFLPHLVSNLIKSCI